MNEMVERQIRLRWPTKVRPTYDVIIIGGGGHGLATAYYLATRHRMTRIAVFERGYIGAGNSGRNTTIIRANYGVPAAVRFYQRSVDLYAALEAETERDLMHRTKGLLWLAHSEAGVRQERARAAINTACGARTEYVEPSQIARICPQIDLTGGGVWPVYGASYHPEGATARHDRVVWAFAEGAMRLGVDVFQHTPVVGLVREGERVVGVQTAAGPVAAGVVVSAVGGHVSTVAEWAGVRLPIRTHPLQAFVTQRYAAGFAPIVASSGLGCYASQTLKGEMLIGAEIDRAPSYAMTSTFGFLQHAAFRMMTVLPFLRPLQVLRQWTGVCDMSTDYSPVMGPTDAPGFLVTTGWGTWGFKAIPAGGEQMAELIATGRMPSLIAPFGLDRFAADRPLADRGSAGTH